MQGSREKELNPQTGARKYAGSKRARNMVRIALRDIQNQDQSSDIGSNNVRPITEQRTLRSEYSQGARLLRAVQSQLNANAPSNVSPSPQPSIGLPQSESSESESEGPGLVSTGYDNHENGRPPKRNRSMSPSNGAAAGWSSTVSGQPMQVAEQAPSPDPFDEEGYDSGSESSVNGMIDDSTYDDAIDDQQQSIQNTADDNQLNSHSPLLPVEPNSIGSQNVAAGEADDTDVIQQPHPSTPTGEEHRIIVNVNQPPNAPRPDQIREVRPLSQRGNRRPFMRLPDDPVENFGNFSQIHDQQANQVQQNTYSTLYMSVIFEALRQSNIGGDYENHPYLMATDNLMRNHPDFANFVIQLTDQFNRLIQTHGEEASQNYLATHFEQNGTYLPAHIQEEIVEMAGLLGELLNLHESDKELEDRIEALLTKFIPLENENIESASLPSELCELHNIGPELRGRIESLLRRGRIPYAVETPDNEYMFAFVRDPQPEDTGNINGGAAEEGSNNNDGGNNHQPYPRVHSPSNGGHY